MAISDTVVTWPQVVTKQFIVGFLLLYFLYQAVLFFYRGIRIRMRMRQLQAQGIVGPIWSTQNLHLEADQVQAIPAPHSLLLGHLPLLKQLVSSLPKMPAILMRSESSSSTGAPISPAPTLAHPSSTWTSGLYSPFHSSTSTIQGFSKISSQNAFRRATR